MGDPRFRLAGFVAALTVVTLACGGDGGDDAGSIPQLVARSGGMTTTFDQGPRALSVASVNINHHERRIFAAGKTLFEAEWEADPDAEFAGLGPHYDTTSCASCHTRDGRAAGPDGDGPLPTGFIVRLTTDDDTVRARLGTQLTSRADGVPAEAVVSVVYEERPGSFADGTPYSLRAPTYLVDLGEGELPDDAVLGVRVAPHLSGLGLLELIPADTVLARSDPDDADGDGISGRPGVAVDLLSGSNVLGRIGWNATQPGVEQQSAVALFHDMGLQSRYFPDDGCDLGGPCPRRGDPVTPTFGSAGVGAEVAGGPMPAFTGEIADEDLFRITVYAQALAVPAVRDLDDPQVQRGWELFHEVGCASCHTGGFTTGQGPIQGLSDQTIHPFTDLLTHDMGEALADRTVGGAVVPTEWRTAPLWGIGLVETVNGHTDLLHDGRARDLSEAILWHGGEAASSAAAFREMGRADRAALVRFLESL